jgi:hypothetical protein
MTAKKRPPPPPPPPPKSRKFSDNGKKPDIKKNNLGKK